MARTQRAKVRNARRSEERALGWLTEYGMDYVIVATAVEDLKGCRAYR